MSDVRYAFSDPCGMEMIIMVIIQHLNNPFSVRNTGKHICPGMLLLVFVCYHKQECVSQRYRRRQEGEAG